MNKLLKYDKIDLKSHPEFNEKWIQEQIAEDPSILGIGELILKDKERRQPGAGRLDLLFQDTDIDRRYEVELQLGKTDESHIIRTIEYWDIERKRYPQYDHCAVIIAEDITSRFLNVISLFNGNIPIIAIQMNAIKVDEKIGLIFTTVLDELILGLDDDDATTEITDRNYWETKRSKKSTIKMVDEMFLMILEFAPEVQLKYNKYYIGLAKSGRPCNFVSFKAKKGFVRLDIKLKQTNEISEMIEQTSLDVMEYDKRWGAYRLRLNKEDITNNRDTIFKLMKMAHENY
ncbi:MAG: DUF5655 domain-containing protein [candidate division Zixibacteria bacterium]|nr:DUF5655 domain-containing protein [candidate division Zixibacteria bacterium]